jgi:hypothetical protein
VLELLPALLGVNAPIEDEGNSHGNSDTAPSSSSSSDTSNIAAAVAIENEMARVLRTMQTINQHTSFFDILSDQSVREGLKTFSNWQSYPQACLLLSKILLSSACLSDFSIYHSWKNSMSFKSVFNI